MAFSNRHDEGEEFDLRVYARLLWRRRWYVLFPFVSVVIVAAGWSFSKAPVYRAETVLRVDAGAVGIEGADPFARLYISRDAVASIIERLKTPSLLDQVATNLKLASKGAKLGEVTTSTIGKTEFFRITVKHPDSALARDVANEIAHVLKLEIELEAQFRMVTAEAFLEVRLAELDAQTVAARQQAASAPTGGGAPALDTELNVYAVQYAEVLSSLQQARSVRARTGEILVIQSPANLPEGPIGSNLFRNITLASLLGAILGVSAAFVREHMDRTPRSPDDVQRLLGVPVMGVIPVLPDTKQSRTRPYLRRPAGSTVDEAYHTLRTNLQASQSVGSGHVVMVFTSSVVGEGKTTTLSNLGVAIAQSGRTTILIDADLRRPRLHEMFGLRLEGGLTHCLAQTPADHRAFLKTTDVPNLRVLTAGSYVDSPSPVLDSEAMQIVLSEVREEADVVLVDTPPVLYANEARILAAWADQVVLILRAGFVSDITLRRAKSALEIVKTKQIHVVLNKVKRESDAYSYYNYYYYNRSRPD